MNDHDILIAVHTIVTHLDKTINGNGQPGLVQDVAALRERVDAITLPTRRRKAVEWTAITTALIAALGSVLVAVLGS